jgi:hypothetical protein
MLYPIRSEYGRRVSGAAGDRARASGAAGDRAAGDRARASGAAGDRAAGDRRKSTALLSPENPALIVARKPRTTPPKTRPYCRPKTPPLLSPENPAPLPRKPALIVARKPRPTHTKTPPLFFAHYFIFKHTSQTTFIESVHPIQWRAGRYVPAGGRRALFFCRGGSLLCLACFGAKRRRSAAHIKPRRRGKSTRPAYAPHPAENRALPRSRRQSAQAPLPRGMFHYAAHTRLLNAPP